MQKYTFIVGVLLICTSNSPDANVCLTSDAYSGYCKFTIRPEDKHKIAFVGHSGTYQYNRIPFGLTKARETSTALNPILTKFIKRIFFASTWKASLSTPRRKANTSIMYFKFQPTYKQSVTSKRSINYTSRVRVPSSMLAMSSNQENWK